MFLSSRFMIVTLLAGLMFILSACSVGSPAGKVAVPGPVGDIYIAKYKDDKQGAFSFTCDDGVRQQVINTLEIIEPLGIRATFFIMPLVMEDPERQESFVTWQQVRDLVAKGHEIGTHGSTSQRLHNASDELLERYINYANDLIAEKAGVRPVSYAVPGGSRATEAVRDVIYQKHYILRDVTTRIPELRMIGYGSTKVRHWDDQKWRKRILGNISSGLWNVAVVHAILEGWSPFKSKDEFRVHCQWLIGQQDYIWIAPIGEVGMYLNASKQARLESEQIGADSLEIRLVCDELTEDIYRDVNLTVVIAAKDVTKAQAVGENGEKLDCKVSDGKVLVQASVNTGTFTVTLE